MLNDFRHFVSRGDIMQLAIGVIIGATFSNLIHSLTSNIIDPVLGIFLDKINFSALVLTVGKAQIRIGSFLSSIINFIIIVIAVFITVKAINIITSHQPKKLTTGDKLQMQTNRELQQINNKLNRH